MDDVSFAQCILAIDQHLPLFWQLLKLSRPRRSLIESFGSSGLLQQWASLGSVGRDAVWLRLWCRTFHTMPPCLPATPEPDQIFVLFTRDRFLGAIVMLEQMRIHGRDDAFETVNALQGRLGRDPVLRQVLALVKSKRRRKSR
jgi:hypothetical protein